MGVRGRSLGEFPGRKKSSSEIAMTPSTTILPYLVADYAGPLPFVDRTYGEPLYHTESEVAGLIYAADDSLWSIEESGVLRQWSREGHLLSRNFLTDLETIWAFSDDATLLAAASDDIVIWDVAGARAKRRMPAATWVTALAFSADGKVLASGHDDGVVRLWNTATGKQLAEWPAHQQAVSAISFRCDQDQLASAGEDRQIHVWDVRSRKCIKTLTGHTDRIPALAWQPGGDILGSAGWDTTARVWDLSKPDPIMLLNRHADQVHALTFSADGQWLAVADSDFNIHVWSDPRQGTVKFVLEGHSDEIKALAFARDGRRLASAGADRVVHLWDMETGQLVAGPNPQARHGIALIDERAIVSTAGAGIQAWELDSTKPTWSPPTKAVLSVATSPNGELLATGGPSPDVEVWNVKSRKLAATLPHTRGPIVNLTFSADSQQLASASVTDGLVWLWRMGEPEAILVIPEAAESSTLETLAFHPRVKWLAVGGIDWLRTAGSDGALCLWDLEQRDKITTVPVGVTSAVFDSTGRYLAAGTFTQTVAVWEVKDMRRVFEFTGHQDRIGAVLFSPDGSWLVSAGDDCTVRVWNMLTGRLAVARQFDAAVQSLAFSPDGRYLFTGNGNTTCYRLELKKLLED
jgi:WD40 repeat protein